MKLICLYAEHPEELADKWNTTTANDPGFVYQIQLIAPGKYMDEDGTHKYGWIIYAVKFKPQPQSGIVQLKPQQ